MKKIAFAAFGMIAAVGSASAADMAVKARPVVVPIYNWTGFYVGVNAGGVWSDGRTDVATVPTFALSPAINAFPGPTSIAAATAATGPVSGNSASFIGGAQIGYNQQFSERFVAGIEADIQGIAKNGRGSRTSVVDALTAVGFPGNNVTVTLAATKTPDYLGTVRGRLGFLPSPALLLYATGGLAYGGGVSTSVSGTNNGGNLGLCCGNPAFNYGASSSIRAGWTIGAGGEWMFGSGWSAKVEYLYYDLGRVSYASATNVIAGLGGGAIAPGTVIYSLASTSTARLDGNIVRVGLNYRFGAPVVAKY